MKEIILGTQLSFQDPNSSKKQSPRRMDLSQLEEFGRANSMLLVKCMHRAVTLTLMEFWMMVVG